MTAEPKARIPPPNLQTLADQLLLQRFSPAAVLSNDNGDILYISGRTGKYLEPAAGKANYDYCNGDQYADTNTNSDADAYADPDTYPESNTTAHEY